MQHGATSGHRAAAHCVRVCAEVALCYQLLEALQGGRRQQAGGSRQGQGGAAAWLGAHCTPRVACTLDRQGMEDGNVMMGRN